VPGPLLSIFLVILVDIFGMTLVFPLQAIYAEHFHASPLQATLLVSTYAGCALVSAPIIGQLSDRYGRKRLLFLSQCGSLIGFVVMAKAQALWMIYVARMIDGSTAGNLALAQAYIADTTKPENRTRSFALIGIAFGLGFVLGPAVTAQLVKYGLAAPIWAAVALSATSILGTIVLLPSVEAKRSDGNDSPAGRRPSLFAFEVYRDLFGRPRLRNLFGRFFLFNFAFTIFTSGFALFAERRFTWQGHPFSPREIGYLFAYTGVLGIVMQGGLIGRLSRRFGDEALTRFGFLGQGCAYLMLAYAPDIPALVVASSLSAVSNSLLRPALTSLLSRAARTDEQGKVMGTNSSMLSCAAIVAPFVGGQVLDHGWVTWLPICAAIASALSLWMSFTAPKVEEP